MVVNKKLPVKCSGDIEMRTVVGKEYFDVLVQNVLYVPEITANLLSMSQLINNGNVVKFEHNSCRIYHSGNRLVATADLIDGVYKLNNANNCFLAAPTIATSGTWHRRLGHINNIYKIKTNELVNGLQYQG